jgi:hypothetical protein
MRRAWVVAVVASLLVGIGCGRESYERRMDASIQLLKYKKRLNANLMEPANDKKFTELSIYIRAPKSESLAKTGQLPVAEGQFDLDATFSEKSDAFLHVLARVKLPKKAAAKGAPPAPPPATRADFTTDVLGVLTNQFGASDEFLPTKLKDETRKPQSGAANRYKRLVFHAGEGKDGELYIYKQDAHEVALIFIYDVKNKNALASKINLTLESFLTGPKAKTLLEGGTVEEEGGEGGGTPAPV